MVHLGHIQHPHHLVRRGDVGVTRLRGLQRDRAARGDGRQLIGRCQRRGAAGRQCQRHRQPGTRGRRHLHRAAGEFQRQIGFKRRHHDPLFGPRNRENGRGATRVVGIGRCGDHRVHTRQYRPRASAVVGEIQAHIRHTRLQIRYQPIARETLAQIS